MWRSFSIFRPGKFRDQEHRLQLYREENHRQAGELATSAAKSAAEIGQLQAQLKDMTRKASKENQPPEKKVDGTDEVKQTKRALEERETREAPAVEMEAMLKQQAHTQQADGIHAFEEREAKLAAKEAEFDQFCAQRTRALEEREAATAEMEAMLKQHAHAQQADGIHAFEEREAKLAAKEAEFDQFCAQRTRALEEREAATVEMEAMLKQQAHAQQADGIHAFEEREAKLAAKEAEFDQFCAQRARALEEREAATVEMEAMLKQEAHTQQADGIHAFEEREAKLAAKEAEFDQFCAQRTRALEEREAATVEMEAMLKQQAHAQQADGIHAFEEREAKLAAKEAEFDQFCAQRARALEEREAATVEMEAMLKQQAHTQQADGIHAIEEREAKLAAKEAEFDQFCAQRTRALEEREAATVEMEAMLKQQAHTQQADGIHAFEEREAKLAAKEAEFDQFCAQRTRALEEREAATVEMEAMLKQEEHTQQADGIHAIEEREAKLAAKEAEFDQFCAQRTTALEEREAATVEMEAMLKQQAHTQQADGIHAFEEREAKLAAKEAEFDQFCAQRTRALEEREAATVEMEAMLKQQAHTQQADGIHAIEEREAKLAAKEAEFDQFCAQRARALEEREAATVEMEAMLKQQAHTQQADGIHAFEEREAKLAAKEAEFDQFCAQRTRALEEREAATVEMEAMLKQQAHAQQADGIHAFEEREAKLAAKEAEFDQFCAQRTTALEEREAATVEMEAMLKQQAHTQQADGIHAFEEREAKLAAKEAKFEKRKQALDGKEAALAKRQEEFANWQAERSQANATLAWQGAAVFEQEQALLAEAEEGLQELKDRKAKFAAKKAQFEQSCAERTRALEEREAAVAEMEAMLKQQPLQAPPASGPPSPGGDISSSEVSRAEAQGQKAADELKALEDREAKLAVREADMEAREAAAAADAKVHSCFYEELEEQKQLLAERDQAALEQAAALEKRELELEESKSKLQIQQKDLEKLEQSLRKRAHLEAQASRQVDETKVKMGALPSQNEAPGGLAQTIAQSILQDVEIGEHPQVTLTHLGLSQISGLPEAAARFC